METNLSNTACFKAHNLKNKSCKNKKCRYWHDIESSNNCIINKINENINNNKDLTLQEIGDIFDITRMRVCQIEKQAIQKIKKFISAK